MSDRFGRFSYPFNSVKHLLHIKFSGGNQFVLSQRFHPKRFPLTNLSAENANKMVVVKSKVLFRPSAYRLEQNSQ